MVVEISMLARNLQSNTSSRLLKILMYQFQVVQRRSGAVVEGLSRVSSETVK
jgi:hypothetical protein